MAEPQKIWIDQCDATANIVNNFGVQPAMLYLIGEKFLDFLEAAEIDHAFRNEIPAFVAKIKTIFERTQMASFLETAKQSEPSAGDLLLIERALKWLTDDEQPKQAIEENQ
jgi:hypothetical protein